MCVCVNIYIFTETLFSFKIKKKITKGVHESKCLDSESPFFVSQLTREQKKMYYVTKDSSQTRK